MIIRAIKLSVTAIICSSGLLAVVPVEVKFINNTKNLIAVDAFNEKKVKVYSRNIEPGQSQSAGYQSQNQKLTLSDAWVIFNVRSYGIIPSQPTDWLKELYDFVQALNNLASKYPIIGLIKEVTVQVTIAAGYTLFYIESAVIVPEFAADAPQDAQKQFYQMISNLPFKILKTKAGSEQGAGQPDTQKKPGQPGTDQKQGQPSVQ